MKQFIAVILAVCSVAFCQSKNERQIIRYWPAGYDTTGKKWVVYNYYAAETKVLKHDTIGSSTVYNSTLNIAMWTANVGNFPGSPPWVVGDTLVAFGSWDSAYAHNPGGYNDNVNHCGFYWLFSDTIIPTEPQTFTPDDTLRAMPKPLVSKTGNTIGDDTVWIKIPNPNETRRADQTQYDVMGFLLYADSGGVGTPNAYAAADVMDFGFIPVQGDTADTTEFWVMESNRWEANTEWPTYFAYRIVALPDTVNSPTEVGGYTSQYMSMNSDSIHILHNVVGIGEQGSVPVSTSGMQVYPNPAHGSFKVSFRSSSKGSAIIRLYDVSGREIGVLWRGQVLNGDNSVDLSSDVKGLYFLTVETDASLIGDKIILK